MLAVATDSAGMDGVDGFGDIVAVGPVLCDAVVSCRERFRGSLWWLDLWLDEDWL